MLAPRWLRDAVVRIEGEARLDRVAAALDPLAARVSRGQAGEILRGEWLGHALHPLATDLPLGCWAAAGLLDVAGGRNSRAAAQRLVGLGLVFVPPTVAAGLADYRTTSDPRTRRVGAVHAIGNTVVAACYWQSWRARRRGRHARGVAWGLAGGGLAWGTGYLGGHLSFGRGVGQGLRGLDAGVDLNEEQLLDRAGASALLEVTPDRIDAMVDEGMLTPVASDRFRRSDVLAVRLEGG